MSARVARPSESERVVITGLGVVSSLGIGVSPFAAGIRAGRSAAGPIEAFDTAGFDHRNGCEVHDFDPAAWLSVLAPDSLGRASQFSVAAARMAVADAGADPAWLRSRRGLVCVGTTDGESYDLDRLVTQELAHGPESMDPTIAARVRQSRLSVAVARELELTDVEAVTIPTACAAGNYAIGYGYDTVRGGDADFALCGGADAVCRRTFAAFYLLGTIAPDVCRPFDADRMGILTGEGAGILLLETLESALSRRTRIYAEILGYGLNCDGHHPVAPQRRSVAECISLALADARVEPAQVDFISAHGTGTRLNDVVETGAIRDVFGPDLPPVVSIKSMLGHTMGAASALATIACALSITHGYIPPTINHRRTDPECGIDCVPNESRIATPRIVQNNGLAFGGNNAVVVIGDCADHRMREIRTDRSESVHTSHPGGTDPCSIRPSSSC